VIAGQLWLIHQRADGLARNVVNGQTYMPGIRQLIADLRS
jgi:hypothetical protein